MLGRIATVAGLLLIAACSPSTSNADDGRHSGVYRAITFGKADPGDMGGYEIEVFDQGKDSRVYFVHCEGACGGGGTFPATVEAGVVTFTVNDGQRDVRYVGRFLDADLMLTSPDDRELNRRLRRKPSRLTGEP